MLWLKESSKVDFTQDIIIKAVHVSSATKIIAFNDKLSQPGPTLFLNIVANVNAYFNISQNKCLQFCVIAYQISYLNAVGEERAWYEVVTVGLLAAARKSISDALFQRTLGKIPNRWPSRITALRSFSDKDVFFRSNLIYICSSTRFNCRMEE